MRTGTRTDGQGAHFTAALRARRKALAWACVGLIGLAPLAASTAAPEAPQPATSTAMVELVPLQTAAEIVPAPVIDEAPAPSAPQETVVGRGSASYYAAKFDGRRTAS